MIYQYNTNILITQKTNAVVILLSKNIFRLKLITKDYEETNYDFICNILKYDNFELVKFVKNEIIQNSMINITLSMKNEKLIHYLTICIPLKYFKGMISLIDNIYTLI